MPTRKVIKKYYCVNCGGEMKVSSPVSANNLIYGYYEGNTPMCYKCIKQLYDYYFDRYNGNDCLFSQYSIVEPSRLAIRKICSLFNLYYSDKLFELAESSLIKKKMNGTKASLMSEYLFIARNRQFKNKTYDDTMDEDAYAQFKANEENEDNQTDNVSTSRKTTSINATAQVKDAKDIIVIEDSTREFFGDGFTKLEYKYLQDQYDDWTSRHECQTKAQEEIFKRLAFNQLEHYKAEKDGKDTKEIDKTFQSLLNSGNLQPKQNKASTLSNGKSIGELIDIYEDNRPLPEVDENLKDVDGLGLMVDVFFKGHTAKNLGVDKAESHLYDEYMKKYTVTKPEYTGDEGNEALFDYIFGSQLDNE